MSGIRQASTFILLHVNILFSIKNFLKRLSFPHWEFLATLSDTRWPYVHGFITGLFILFSVMYLFLCQYYIFYYYTFVYSLKSGPPGLLFFFILFWLFCVLCGSIYILPLFFYITVENAFGILTGIALNLLMALGSMDIVTILILVVRHMISSHFFVSS